VRLLVNGNGHTNVTINGVQLQVTPQSDRPLVAIGSSQLH
jgi:hypothetical protein